MSQVGARTQQPAGAGYGEPLSLLAWNLSEAQQEPQRRYPKHELRWTALLKARATSSITIPRGYTASHANLNGTANDATGPESGLSKSLKPDYTAPNHFSSYEAAFPLRLYKN